jgi:hypothetical protein
MASGYLNAANDDRDLLKGVTNYKCYPENQLYTILNKNGRKDEITTVTAKYEVVLKITNKGYQEPSKNSKIEFSQVVYASTAKLISDGLKFMNVYQIYMASHAALI